MFKVTRQELIYRLNEITSPDYYISLDSMPEKYRSYHEGRRDELCRLAGVSLKSYPLPWEVK